MQRDLRRQRGSKAYRALPMVEILEPRCLMSGVLGSEVGFGVESGSLSAITVTSAASAIQVKDIYKVAGADFLGAPVVASDGAVWAEVRYSFEKRPVSQILRVGADGVATSYWVTGQVRSIIAGENGSVYFSTEHTIGQVRVDGQITVHEIPAKNPAIGAGQVGNMARASDGVIWFASIETNEVATVGKLKTDGTVEYVELGVGNYADTLVAGKNGSMWVSGYSRGNVYQGFLIHFGADGSAVEVGLPTAGLVFSTTYDAESGDLWVVTWGANDLSYGYKFTRVNNDNVITLQAHTGLIIAGNAVFVKDGELYMPSEIMGSRAENTQWATVGGFIVIGADGERRNIMKVPGSPAPRGAAIGANGEMWYVGMYGELVHFQPTALEQAGAEVQQLTIGATYWAEGARAEFDAFNGSWSLPWALPWGRPDLDPIMPWMPPRPVTVPVTPVNVPVAEPEPVPVTDPVWQPHIPVGGVLEPIDWPVFVGEPGTSIVVGPPLVLIGGTPEVVKTAVSFVVKGGAGLFGELEGGASRDFLSLDFGVKTGKAGESLFPATPTIGLDDEKKLGDEDYLVEAAE